MKSLCASELEGTLEMNLSNSLFFWKLKFLFLGPHLQHMEVLRLGVESELFLPIYSVATATWVLSCICGPIPWLMAVLGP